MLLPLLAQSVALPETSTLIQIVLVLVIIVLLMAIVGWIVRGGRGWRP